MLFVFLLTLAKQANKGKSIKDELRDVSSTLPISIRSAKMKKGDVKCDENNCPTFNNIDNYHPDSEDTYQCGETCTTTGGSFEYTFKGVKFGIYGVYSTNNGNIDISVDDQKVSSVNLNRQSKEKYSLVYLSNELSYQEHTVKIVGQGSKQFQIYKLVFWPSLKAKRLNISELTRTGAWKYESDKIGGLRAYTEKDSSDDTASAKIRFSKVWVYGTKCNWHGKLNLNINQFTLEINSNGPYDDETRLDSALLYESPDLSTSDELQFSLKETATLNYIYYIEEPPISTPSADPISIRSAKMTKVGEVTCGQNDCPNINNDLNNYKPNEESTYNCGETCSTTSGSLEYTFKGVKFGIYGVCELDKGKYDILLNGRKLAEVNSAKQSTSGKYSLLYMSDDLTYQEYKVKIEGKGDKQFQIYKLVFWPSLKAKRMNLTEMERTGTWHFETDLIGGIRGYTEGDSTTDTAYSNIRFSKLWVYGTIANWHSKFSLSIESFQTELNAYGPYDDNTRLDSALLYESPELSPSTGFKFTMTSTTTLNYVYYIEEPAINLLEAIPISIRSAKMKKEGDVTCGQNNCQNINNNVNNYKPNEESTYTCGEACSATSGSFEYKFIGVKFGIYSAYSQENGKYNILLDGQKVSEVDTAKFPTAKYTISYVSDDLKYGKHTVRIEGRGGKKYQIYKLVFWPSLKAKRMNITEFTRTGKWKYETDLIGGIRAYTEADDSSDKATADIRFSKIWLYGTICSWHGKFNVTYGNIQAELSERDSRYNNDDLRLDSELLFESPLITVGNYKFEINLEQTVTLNYIYYEELPLQTPEPIPISIRSAKMNKTEMECTPNNCTGVNYNPDSEEQYQCGEVCTTTGGSFEYSFTGVKFGIFGVCSKENGAFDISIDDQNVGSVDLNRETTEKYSLVYVSDDLSYHKHTVKIQGKDGQKIQLYKLVFWPSLTAKRMNITDFSLSGNWTIETDLIGGLRAYTLSGGLDEVAVAQFPYSKVWVYGTICEWHGKLNADIGDIQAELNEKDPNLTSDDSRLDSELLFESPEFVKDNYTVKFTIKETATLNFIYYIDDDESKKPIPTPSVIPVSIPFDSMTKEGVIKYYKNNACPTTNLDSPSAYNCGPKSITYSGTFTYNFYGEKFGIIGSYSPSYGKFALEIDSKRIEIDTNKDNYQENALIYFSDDLQYKQHTIKVQAIDENVQLYKLIYWPSLRAKRINITDFKREGTWQEESDTIGGIRAYTAKGGVNETAVAQIHCSHVWVYGSKCSWHGNLILDIGDAIHETINEHIDGQRLDAVLIYESGDFRTDEKTVKFTIMDTATLNYIYYIEVPSPIPTPSAIPISIQLDQMNKEGDIICYSNECPVTDLDTPKAYQCGTKCSTSTGKYNYTFKGEKFALIGARASNYDKFHLIIDSDTEPIEINANAANTDEFTILYLSDDLSYSEHTIKIEGTSGLFKLYKLVYWPTLLARRVNITDFKREGTWQEESDTIGGIRAYTEKGGVNETAVAQVHCSHLWVYGTKCSWHGNLILNVGDAIRDQIINSKVDDPHPKRYDAVLMYESINMRYDSYPVSFTIMDTATIYYVYYLDAPPPSETPTPSYTPEPTPLQIELNETFCKDGDALRCLYENNEDERYNVVITITEFTGLTDSNKDKKCGAAIRLINTGFQCTMSSFKKCESRNDLGGAVYLENNFKYQVDYDLQDLVFDECKAKCGGAVYLYCVSERSTINIVRCNFTKNEALAGKNEDFFGGSALFLTCLNSNCVENVFFRNTGFGGAVKIYQKFKEKDSGALLLNGYSSRRLVTLSRCTFEISNESDCSLFYFGARSDVKVELKDSVFNGYLAVGSHHISGSVASKEASKIDVKNCRFSEEFKKSVRVDRADDYISINLRNQVFEYMKEKNNEKHVSNEWKITCLAAAAIVVAGIAFTLNRKKSEEQENEQVDNPLSLTDSNE